MSKTRRTTKAGRAAACVRPFAKAAQEANSLLAAQPAPPAGRSAAPPLRLRPPGHWRGGAGKSRRSRLRRLWFRAALLRRRRASHPRRWRLSGPGGRSGHRGLQLGRRVGVKLAELRTNAVRAGALHRACCARRREGALRLPVNELRCASQGNGSRGVHRGVGQAEGPGAGDCRAPGSLAEGPAARDVDAPRQRVGALEPASAPQLCRR